MTRKPANTPPYVPRKGLRAVLDHAQVHKAGETLSRDELHKRGLSSHWTYPALAALRFLGILDDDDRLTGKHLAFNPEKPDLDTQKKLILKAYSDFFDNVKLPLANLDALKNKFREVYGLSERVTNSAFPIFQSLADESGIELVRQGAQAGATSDADRKSDGSQTQTAGIGDGDAALLSGDVPLRVRHTGYQVVINLQVTKYTTEKDLIKMIRTANRAIHLMKKAGDRH
jgi:hypothetical protein